MKISKFFSAALSLACGASLMAADPAAPAAPAPTAEAPAVKPAPSVESLLKFIPDVVATINGKDAVTGKELRDALKPMIEQALAQGAQVDEAQIKMFAYNMAEQGALTKAVLAEATKAGLKADMEACKKNLEAMMNQVNSQEPADDKRFDEELKKLGITRESFLEKLAERNILEQFSQNVLSKVKEPAAPTEEELQKFYDENKEQMKKPELLAAAHILVQFPSKKPTDDEKAAALKKIEDLKAQLKADGSNFAEIAKASSDCPSKEQGGDLGQFPRGAMVREFEDALLKLKAGEISGPVETIFGYHLIKAGAITPESVTPFAEAKDQIKQYLTSMAKDKANGEAFKAEIDKIRAVQVVKILIEMPQPPAAPATPAAK